MADLHLEALRSSVARLRSLASTMSEEQLRGPAYPSEWSIADVLSHIGSGAVIMQRRLDDALAGGNTPDDFAPGVWSTWNAKSPTAQRDDALAADSAFQARIENVPVHKRDTFRLAMGPITLDFDALKHSPVSSTVGSTPNTLLPAPIAVSSTCYDGSSPDHSQQQVERPRTRPGLP